MTDQLKFNVIEDPWIDVLWIDGSVSAVSLRQLFQSAEQIASLSESSPLVEVALLRFLVALFSDGLRGRLSNEDSWKSLAERCSDSLPDEEVQAVLAPLAGRANVLDPDHSAFFDGPSIRRIVGWDEPKAWQPATQLLPELPTGTNIAHFVHSFNGESAMCVVCLLKSRALDAAFARGGLGPSLSRNLLASISGSEPRYVIVSGVTLIETLLLNAVVGDPSRPAWIAIHSPIHGTPGSIARMSWRPRLMMPVESSQTQACCARCGSADRPRFTQVVLLDTYNHAGSPFGSKSDVERWKSTPYDPHLLNFEKGALTLGGNPREWPVRALTRILGASENTSIGRLADRVVLTEDLFTVTVTSSAGNQMKIDDAPHATARFPSSLLARPREMRAATAAAIRRVLEMTDSRSRERIFGHALPKLFDDLALSPEPDIVLDEWSREERETCSATAPFVTSGNFGDKSDTVAPVDVDPEDEHAAWTHAQRIVNRLFRLTPCDRAALKPRQMRSADELASAQAAFEKVWYRLGLPSHSKRHSLRSALATIASVYAVFPGQCRSSANPYAFERQLKQCLAAEKALAQRPNAGILLSRRVQNVIHASPNARDDRLFQLVESIVSGNLSGGGVSIDLADLFVALTRWSDPFDPTPLRWLRLLPSTREIKLAT